MGLSFTNIICGSPAFRSISNPTLIFIRNAFSAVLSLEVAAEPPEYKAFTAGTTNEMNAYCAIRTI